MDLNLQPYSREHPDAIGEKFVASTFTYKNVTVALPDGARVAAYIKSLPPGTEPLLLKTCFPAHANQYFLPSYRKSSVSTLCFPPFLSRTDLILFDCSDAYTHLSADIISSLLRARTEARDVQYP